MLRFWQVCTALHKTPDEVRAMPPADLAFCLSMIMIHEAARATP